MKKLFLVRVMWYDEFQGESKTDSCFLFGDDLMDATSIICSCFDEIESLNIKEVSPACDPILFVPDDQKIIKQISDCNIF